MGLFSGLGNLGLGIAEGIGTIAEGIGKAGLNLAEHSGGGIINLAKKEGIGKLATAIGIGALTGGMISSHEKKSGAKGALVGGTTVGAGIALGAPLGISTAGIVTDLGASAIGIGIQVGVTGTSLASKAVVMPEGPIMQNIENIRLKKGAGALLIGTELLKGTADAYRTFEKSRMGVNDGRLRTATPDIPIQNTQNNYSVNRQGGIDYSGTGASGDLVFAMK